MCILKFILGYNPIFYRMELYIQVCQLRS